MASGHSSLSFGFSTFVFWLLLLTRVDAQNQSSEVQALLFFKDDMTNSPFALLPTDLSSLTESLELINPGVNSRGFWSSWNASDESPCAWVGVTCTATSTVGELDLSGWGLLDYRNGFSNLNSLSFLPDLRHLDVSSNYLGYVPTNLTQLTYLDMSRNNLSGEIPSNISAYTSLRYLSLAENQLRGEIPSLDGLTDLQVLLLADNQLSGQFPKELGEISSLINVDLSGNMLNGTIPFLSKATKLLHLDLGNNGFTEFDPFFPAGSENLEYLSTSGNQLVGTIPPGIANLRNLQYLDLSRNNISGNIPPDLLRSRLIFGSFNLSYNLLSGDIPSLNYETVDLFYYTAYDVLDLSHNNLSGPFPSSYSQNWVRSLFLQNNNLSGDIVEVLWRYNNSQQTANPTCSVSCAQNCTYLLNQNTSTRTATCTPFICIGDTSCTYFPYYIFPELSFELNCNSESTNLEVCLKTTVTTFTNNDSCYATGFSLAEELRLDNNSFTGDLSRLATFSICWNHLQLVDLSNNQLQMTSTKANPDPLTAAIDFFMYTVGDDSSLLELRLGGNNFSGTSLPAASFGANETLLQVLDLSNSHLKGQISGAVFNSTWLPDLQVLNLSANSLTGPVPKSIIQLPNLAILNVTNNRLSGRLPPIPSNSLLYNPGFFAGNSGLCGDPLPPCEGRGVPWWVLFLVVGGSVIILAGVCLGAIWQWRVYRKRHQQDADLIQTLLERESTALMPLRELKRATSNFSQSSQIGEGGFGTVYQGRLDDQTMVAIKRSKREGSDKDKGQFLNEVKILSQLNHRHLVKLLGCCMENKIALLVFEFVSNGTLEDHLHGKSGATRLSWKERLNIAVQTADALNYLHSSTTIPIFHRDVKSANILLDDDLNAKVADFGISKLAPADATHVSTLAIQGTLGYIDPEYSTTCQFTDKSDVYSFGVVLLELISAKRAIDFQRGGNETSLVFFSRRYIGSEDVEPLIDPTLMDTYTEPLGHGRQSILKVGRLALECVNMHSKARPSMNEVGRELQNLRLDFSGTSQHSGSLNGDNGNYSRNDSTILSSKTSPSSTLSKTTPRGTSTF